MNKVHVTLLGKEPLPVFYLIQKFSLKDIYVLGTNENKGVYGGLERVCRYIGCKIEFVEVRAFDIKDVIAKCEEIHRKYSGDVKFVYNLTGGTKPMAIGAYIIAKRYESDIYYTDSKSCLNLNTFEVSPMEEKVANEIIFILQGQKLKKYSVWDKDNEKENIAASQDILRFIRKEKNLYTKLVKKIKDSNGYLNNCRIGSAEYDFYDGDLTITKNDKEVLRINTPMSKKLLFEGRWWECLVADAMARWAKGKYEIWSDVVFDTVGDVGVSADKNEVDVLINIGNTIVFVECKSGNLTQNEIYKMASVKQIYGSDKSKSVLVTFWPLKADLRQKADDQQISVIAPASVNEDVLYRIPDEMDKIVKKLTL